MEISSSQVMKTNIFFPSRIPERCLVDYPWVLMKRPTPTDFLKFCFSRPCWHTPCICLMMKWACCEWEAPPYLTVLTPTSACRAAFVLWDVSSEVVLRLLLFSNIILGTDLCLYDDYRSDEGKVRFIIHAQLFFVAVYIFVSNSSPANLFFSGWAGDGLLRRIQCVNAGRYAASPADLYSCVIHWLTISQAYHLRGLLHGYDGGRPR